MMSMMMKGTNCHMTSRIDADKDEVISRRPGPASSGGTKTFHRPFEDTMPSSMSRRDVMHSTKETDVIYRHPPAANECGRDEDVQMRATKATSYGNNYSDVGSFGGRRLHMTSSPSSSSRHLHHRRHNDNCSSSSSSSADDDDSHYNGHQIERQRNGEKESANCVSLSFLSH